MAFMNRYMKIQSGMKPRCYLLCLVILTALLAGCSHNEKNNGIGAISKSHKAEETPDKDVVIRIEDDSDSYTTSKATESEDNATDVVEAAEESEDTQVNLPESEQIALNTEWKYADYTKINSGTATLYYAKGNRRDRVIGINAGHGTSGGQSVKTQCHPDGSAKVTGGTTAAGSTTAVAVSGGMTFHDGSKEANVTYAEAVIVKDKLLAAGYDVLMIRDGDDVQLDNIARTVIANNTADCMISLHWDGDNLDYDKGCFYISTPDGIKGMEPVASHWQEHESLGKALVNGLKEKGCKIYKNGSMSIDLTQTSYSTIPSIDIELGNAASSHDEATLGTLADGLVLGIDDFFAN